MADEAETLDVGEMVFQAIKGIANDNGSSLSAIKKFMVEKYSVDDKEMADELKKFVKSALEDGRLVQTTGRGVGGSFRLPGDTDTANGSNSKPSSPKKKKAEGRSKRQPKSKKTTVKRPAVIKDDDDETVQEGEDDEKENDEEVPSKVKRGKPNQQEVESEPAVHSPLKAKECEKCNVQKKSQCIQTDAVGLTDVAMQTELLRDEHQLKELNKPLNMEGVATEKVAEGEDSDQESVPESVGKNANGDAALKEKIPKVTKKGKAAGRKRKNNA